MFGFLRKLYEVSQVIEENVNKDNVTFKESLIPKLINSSLTLILVWSSSFLPITALINAK